MKIYSGLLLLSFLLVIFSCSKDSEKSVKPDSLDSSAIKDTTQSVDQNDVLETKQYIHNGYFLEIKNNDPILDTAIRNDLVQLFFSVYPKIVQRFNTVATNKIIIKIDTAYSGEGKVTGNKIILNASNTNDIDKLTYKLGYLVIKNYPNYNPAWLMGAFPFYIRYSYGIKNNKDSWSLPDYNPNQKYFNNSLVAARFLVWLENNIKEGVVDQLNSLLINGTYSQKSLGDITGFSLTYLWNLYRSHPQLELTDSQLELSESIKTKHYTREGINLTFKSNDFYLDTSIRRKLVNTFFKVYREEMSRFNDHAPKDITFLIDTAYSGIAYTLGTKVVFSADFYHLHSDVDVLTHEAMHLTQSYPRYNPVWLVEGIADYARYVFGLHNLSANWTLPNYSSNQSYTDSYRVTARFLIWLEVNVNEKIVDKLNFALRADTYNKNIWKDITGRSLDELWEEYGRNPKLDLQYKS